MISENISKIRARIALVCSKVNRDPDSITIVAVSKNRTAEEIIETVESGISDIGENKIQEASVKYNNLKTHYSELRQIKWHMVGHLQTNKVKTAVRIFDLIHSVDSLRLALEIDKQAGKINKFQDVLIEVNTSQEAAKFGLKPDEIIGAIKEFAKFKNINIKGLMTIAPVVDSPEKSRPYFRMLRELRDRVNQLSAISYPVSALSMGMTDDFEVAIEEGADMVRIGRAIFKE